MVRAGWGLAPGPVHNVTRLLESHGCVVFAHPFGHRKLDAFSARMAGRPAFIHINEDLPPDRWRYTLAHELGHLVMHNDLGCFPGGSRAGRASVRSRFPYAGERCSGPVSIT